MCGEADRLPVTIQAEPEGQWFPCLVDCGDPDCREWVTVQTDPDPERNNVAHLLCHISECEMLDLDSYEDQLSTLLADWYSTKEELKAARLTAMGHHFAMQPSSDEHVLKAAEAHHQAHIRIHEYLASTLEEGEKVYLWGDPIPWTRQRATEEAMAAREFSEEGSD